MNTRQLLNDYLRSVNDKPFAWGKHDCLIFTNNAYKAMYGEGWADDWLYRYMPEGKVLLRKNELKKEYGFNTLEDGIDSKLNRLSDISCYIPVGALVTTTKASKYATGAAFGIYTGRHGAFVGSSGVLYFSIEDIKDAWVRK